MTFDFTADPYFEDSEMARQQQQQPQRGLMPPAPPTVTVEAVLCVSDDQKRYLPKRAQLPTQVPLAAIPRVGEAVYITPQSAWAVELVANVWITPLHLRIEVWLEHVQSSRRERPSGFALM